MKQFGLYWRDGKHEVVEGDNITQAVNSAGYGAGALGALDFYTNNGVKEYSWDAQTKDWNQIDGLYNEPIR